jgi:hypothetical protein
MPVSRILYPQIPRTAIIHLGRPLPNGSSSLPENAVQQNTGTGSSHFVFLFGLAPRGVYLAGRVATPAGELLPHRFTLDRRISNFESEI